MLAGRVNVTNHILTWTAPSSGITRYQLQSKDPARGGWHFPSGGSATPSSLSATTLTWSIVTPASLVRHYRVRATDDDGDGPWSGVVALTSAGPPARLRPAWWWRCRSASRKETVSPDGCPLRSACPNT